MNVRPKFVAAVCVISALGLGITGCATAPSGSSSSGASNVAIPDDGAVMTSDYTHLANADSVEKLTTLDDDHDSVPWAVIASSANSPVLFIAYRMPTDDSQCGGHVGSNVVETDTQVVVAAVNERPQSWNENCVAESEVGGGSITLEEPLGSRTLMHAAVSTSWQSAPALETRTPEPSPTPAITQTYSGDATCTNLIDAETYKSLKSKGYIDISNAYADKTRSDPDGDLFTFLEYGGLVCAWAAEDSQDVSLVYAYGPISSEGRDRMTSKLERADYLHEEKSGSSVLFTYASGGGSLANGQGAGGGYALGEGYWALSLDNGGGNVLKEIIKNAPAF
ncbi:hypothetical protein QT381_09000 [Galbitalea sp. SE-J8]|uniref:hypothetical protein n=1 Tax=Galbitalea sp. SE-J8 TaxID=3054952 RepID=UPI00259D2404|nr:hypothetical protein [Galbitalea sp. SE-J8]MDM4763145.1 hypothetical protein [Galbitalea sp. SE-J8]